MKTTTSLPGFESPAVGMEQPFEMLHACHDRVRRSLALLGRLIAHIDQHGEDERSRSAAQDVLRYFDIAAPLHHQDEELHVFPALADADAELRAAVLKLHEDHEQMESLWLRLRLVLVAWSSAAASGGVSDEARSLASQFEALYGMHLKIEEKLVFPAARRRMGDAALAAMSDDMRRRRFTAV